MYLLECYLWVSSATVKVEKVGKDHITDATHYTHALGGPITMHRVGRETSCDLFAGIAFSNFGMIIL